MIDAVGVADAREQKPQVVVDLGDGADRRARIVRRRLLLDGDGGRQAFDQVDVGLLHQLQELTRIRGQRLDIAPLSFGVERVECERALARTGKSRDHDQPVTREIQTQVLEIVRACAANADLVHALSVRMRNQPTEVVRSAEGAKGNLLVYCGSRVRPNPSFSQTSSARGAVTGFPRTTCDRWG